jgi:N-acetylglucosaminyldiphosphoundecaprenol N-acetyl-beta-D-mannosaminyltransferase
MVPVDAHAEDIRGVMVSRLCFARVVERLVDWAGRHDQLRYFACVNAHSAEVAHRDAAFMSALKNADLLVADGYGVILASRILGGRIRERSTGPDLFLAISKDLALAGGKSVFYLGGSEATLEKIRAKHEAAFPGLKIAGMYAPPFRASFTDAELANMAEQVNHAAPNVLWIGLGAPKQEKWILANRDRLRVPLCGPIGAMFDYFAGNVAMPPRWVERAGLHWAYRLFRNPRRLWRRNLDSPLFLARVLADRLRGIRSTAAPSPPRSS